MDIKNIDKSTRWQAPGNGKGFDSFLGDNSKMNNRTIGILSYIKKESNIKGFVSEQKYKDEILDYLIQNFNADKNDSLITHFYKPALFYGFIHRDKDYNLSLSIEGNLFLNSYDKKDFFECKKLIINQLDNTTYPNQATPQVKSLKLFPFRILFKLLLDESNLDIEFIKNELVYIYDYDNFIEYKKTSKLNSINNSTSIKYKEQYDKFYTWVINSLVDLKILKNDNKNISLHEDSLNHIEMLYKHIDYNNMFFNDTTCEVNQDIAKKRIKRDASLIIKAKQRDKFICTIDKTHKTFISKGENYVEGHHILPMFQQKNYTIKLDTLENIASLCPNCHREIHSADNKTEILKKLYNINNKYMQANNINLNDLYKMYSCS